MVTRFIVIALPALLLTGCEHLGTVIERDEPPVSVVGLDEVAGLLSSLPIGAEQVDEVYDAVSSSRLNGYDEEYRMRDLFCSPGSGVGDDDGPTKATGYAKPMRSLIEDYLATKYRTKAGGYDTLMVNNYMNTLMSSGLQIYWPYSCDNKMGAELPIITFDPGDGSEVNEGYLLTDTPSGRLVEKIVVNEAVARQRPVWVVNTNDDSAFKTLEVLRRDDPEWGTGGGGAIRTKGENNGHSHRTLFLRSFQATRQYDSWFAGASEFFIKVGAVEDFTASTEAEMRLYTPSVTDFMVVTRRTETGQDKPFDVVLVSDWTEQLENCALIILEDDGGTRTTWKTSATVKYNSKSYGFDISIPVNIRDDIVWRGQLSSSYIEKYAGSPSRLGDVIITLDLI